MKLRSIHAPILMSAVLLCIHCAELLQMANIQKPKIKLASMRITSLSLQNIGLAFDVNIKNPNPVSIHLAGLDYDFRLNNASFLKGSQNRDLRIRSHGTSRIEIPLLLSFNDLYKTYQTLKNQDSTEYTLICGLSVQLPLLGDTRIPVQKTGHLPLIKIPKISIHALKLDRLNLSGADLVLELRMDNPNAFKLLLSKLNYDFNVNGRSWAQGNLSTPLAVNAKSDDTICIPVSLNFIEMGRSVYALVSGKNDLDYHLSGNLGFDTSLPMLKNIDLPVKSDGSLKITR
ncbi:LEA type 2 family protein [bacterium]|nr:LEA type 2 family protein [bacterium]